MSCSLYLSASFSLSLSVKFRRIGMANTRGCQGFPAGSLIFPGMVCLAWLSPWMECWPNYPWVLTAVPLCPQLSASVFHMLYALSLRKRGLCFPLLMFSIWIQLCSGIRVSPCFFRHPALCALSCTVAVTHFSLFFSLSHLTKLLQGSEVLWGRVCFFPFSPQLLGVLRSGV